MKTQVLFVLFIITSLLSIAQPDIEWSKTYGGSQKEWGTIEPTSDGGYITASICYSDDGQVQGHHGTIDNTDIWVVKLNASGNIQWQKSLGDTLRDEVYCIKQTPDGGYILAGSRIAYEFYGSYGGDKCWIIKLTASGNIQWKKTFGGNSVEKANFIEPISDGGYIVAAYSASTEGQVSGNHGGYDCWIIKLNSVGEIEWQKSLGGSLQDIAYSIHKTTDGGYIVAADTYSNDGDVTDYKGEMDYWIIKLNKYGNIQWQKTLGGSLRESPNPVVQTPDGGFMIAGHSKSNDGQVSGNHGYYDAWVVKLSSSGSIIWKKTYGGSNDDLIYDMVKTPQNEYLVLGKTYSTDGDVSGYHGMGDMWLIKINSSGNLIWQKAMGGSSIESGGAVRCTPDGGIILSGYSDSSDGDVPNNRGEYDLWVVKLEPDNSTFTATVNSNLPNSAIYVDRNDGMGFSYAGNTGFNGSPLNVPNLKINDKLRAIKLVYTEPSVKNDHECVDNTMFELWKDSDIIRNNGSYLPVKITSQQGNYYLNCNHSVYKYNLVLSVSENLSEDNFESLTSWLKVASQNIYNTTDGQAYLNKVAIFDNDVHNETADIIMHYYPGKCKANVNGIDEESIIWPHESQMKMYLPLDNTEWHYTFDHEFGHYAFGLYDEYLNGCNKEWIDEEWLPGGDKHPITYGLMQCENNALELSSSNDYLNDYPPFYNFPQVTSQLAQSDMSCWNYLIDKWQDYYNNDDIVLPPNGWYPPNPPYTEGCSYIYDRIGPDDQNIRDKTTVIDFRNKGIAKKKNQTNTKINGNGAAVSMLVNGQITMNKNVIQFDFQFKIDSIDGLINQVLLQYGNNLDSMIVTQSGHNYAGEISYNLITSNFRGEADLIIIIEKSGFQADTVYVSLEVNPLSSENLNLLYNGNFNLNIDQLSTEDLCLTLSTKANPYNSSTQQIYPVSEMFSVDMDRTDNFLIPAALNVYYTDEKVRNYDESTVGLYLWNESIEEWVIAEDFKVSPTENVLISEILNGGVYCLFAQSICSDTIAPCVINDLTAVPGNNQNTINLHWTVPFDSLGSENIFEYILKYSEEEITIDNWNECLSIDGLENYGQSGYPQSFTIRMPEENVLYYFAMRSTDKCGNLSEISNIAFSTTNCTDYTFSLINPGYNSIVDLQYPTFTWEPFDTDNTITYTLLLSETPSFENMSIYTEVSSNEYTLTEPLIKSKSYFWKVFAQYPNGDTIKCNEALSTFTTSESLSFDEKSIDRLLFECYPNPAKEFVSIVYNLDEASPINISIYNCFGRLTSTIVNESKTSGAYMNIWHSDLIPGIYFFKFTKKDYSITRKIVLIK